MPQTFKKNNTAAQLVLLAGLLLIPAGYLMITREEERTNTGWLNVAVIFIIYLVNVVNIAGFSTGIAGFSAAIPRLTIRWAAIVCYTILSVGGMVFFWQNASFSFSFQLLYQLACLFILAVFYVVGNAASAKTAEVNAEEQQLFALLTLVKQYSADLDFALKNNSGKRGDELLLTAQIKDNARYLSPSAMADAYSLEKQIIAELESLITMAAGPLPDRQLFKQKLTYCDTLIKQRKQLYFN